LYFVLGALYFALCSLRFLLDLVHVGCEANEEQRTKLKVQSSLTSQRLDWIDFRCAASRQIARQQTDCTKKPRSQSERQRIFSGHAKQQRFHNPTRRECSQ
jgi:hypothetical protein